MVKTKRAAPTTVSKVLVIKLSAMGDALCLMPAMRQAHNAGIEVEWLTTKRTNPAFFTALNFIQAAHILPMDPIGLMRFITCFRWKQYDAIIDCDQYYHLSEWLALKGGFSAGFLTPLKGNYFDYALKYDPQGNEKVLFLDLISKSLGFEKKSSGAWQVLPELAVASADAQKAMDAVGQAIVIYPGSSGNGGNIRRWPIERFVQLGENLVAQGEQVVIAGGADESALVTYFGSDVHVWIKRFSLFEWSYFFRYKTKLFIGTDGGLSHVAIAQGAKTLTISGPNLGSKWADFSKKSFMQHPISCSPCIKNYLGQVPQHCKRGDLACLQRIEVTHVIQRIEQLCP